MWLEHLLLLSMLQHAERQWTWGRYVVVHPAGNAARRRRCAPATATSWPTNDLCGDHPRGAPRRRRPPEATTAALRHRYLPD